MSHQHNSQDKFSLSQPTPGKDSQYDQQKSGGGKQDQNKQPSGMPNDNQRNRDSDRK